MVATTRIVQSHLVALDMLAELRGGVVEFSIGQKIDETAMTLDSPFPLRLLHALAKPLEEDVEQVSEGYERLQPAGFQQRTMELNVKRDEGLQVTS